MGVNSGVRDKEPSGMAPSNAPNGYQVVQCWNSDALMDDLIEHGNPGHFPTLFQCWQPEGLEHSCWAASLTIIRCNESGCASLHCFQFQS